MTCTEAGVEAQDTLQVVKDMYLEFKTDRAPDHLSDDIISVIVPGASSDNRYSE